MLIEQPPHLYRLLFPEALWQIKVAGQKTVYLTFDDGPIPEVTPWVLDLLDHHDIKATFFCVGDNVRKYPDLYHQLLGRGHLTGNHTFNHVQAWKNSTSFLLRNANKAAELIDSTLFRPPHGHMRVPQNVALQQAGYKVVMWDVVTRDYSRYTTPEQVLENVKKYVRDGSIIVFHDSLKAEKNMKYALPLAIEWLKEEGYTFELIPARQSNQDNGFTDPQPIFTKQLGS
ncbi:polysaccharide deacetylase family protein [Proteiniphilum sp.]|uniref:polysaccharide deacetylase family protein n=1 Tax=Proteiniphilum sp. TaxID=1926877 RepID=UPI002B2098F5|nr:polysaccharide deacetylase family protein [Proteiniphilum sp.]MEA4917656.1 polysaccharide deacetylase family protein [Proteiniphilum sp.]